LNLKWGFPLAGGALVTNPVSDADEIPELQVRAWIEDALNETKTQKVTGKEITPFILDYIRLASAGRSVKTNISLVKNNAKLAAQIAIELKKCN
jgi:pseudouridine-5'-phosphate glycosidase